MNFKKYGIHFLDLSLTPGCRNKFNLYNIKICNDLFYFVLIITCINLSSMISQTINLVCCFADNLYGK